ncbi:hypothetical protein PIB30_033079 [Stylosanthes scabra]|uniref:Uncharacterized protein n=1 Tax=Stylosanthes scabra TaxID=79078 RepID=A0ABU6QC23_9FABA|nr:hypothetical protein [Stylosanthes scabra]
MEAVNETDRGQNTHMFWRTIICCTLEHHHPDIWTKPCHLVTDVQCHRRSITGRRIMEVSANPNWNQEEQLCVRYPERSASEERDLDEDCVHHHREAPIAQGNCGLGGAPCLPLPGTN